MIPTVAEKRRRFAELHRSPGCFVMPEIRMTSGRRNISLRSASRRSRRRAPAWRLRPARRRRRRPGAGVEPHQGGGGRGRGPAQCGFRGRFRPRRRGRLREREALHRRWGAGFSIEDYTGDRNAPLFAISEGVERLNAARAAINASGETVLLTARSEAILRQAGGLPEALRRLQAYAEAGADVLYAPGLKTPEEVAEVVRVAGTLPVNVLVGAPASPPSARRPWRQTHQHRRRARPRGMGSLDARRARHRGARPL